MATVLNMLELLLPQDMRRDVVDGLGEHWEQTGMPENAEAIAVAIVRDPQAWHSLLVEPEGRESEADRSPPLRDPYREIVGRTFEPHARLGGIHGTETWSLAEAARPPV